MGRFLYLHVQAAKDALRELFAQPISTLLVLLMLAIAITLPLALYLGVQSSQPLLGRLNPTPQITVYLMPEASVQDSTGLGQTLSQDARIARSDLIPKDKALAQMQQSMGEQDLTALLGENPLPDAYVVIPQDTRPQAVRELADDLAKLPKVDKADVDTQWLQTLFNFNEFIRKVMWFLAITLALAFILVANNTIRLQILSHKEEIEITKLLGAPSSFIRRPFLYQAWWQGMLALGIGLALCAWLVERTRPMLAQMFQPYGLNLAWRFFTPLEIAALVLMVSALAVFGAAWAIWRHLSDFKAQA